MTQVRNIEQAVPIWESAETESLQAFIYWPGTPQATSIEIFGSVGLMGEALYDLPAHIGITVSKDVIAQMQTEIDELKARVATLEAEVEAMRALEEHIVILRTISREQAKQEILALFSSREALDQADLAERLSLELSFVAELCEELMQKGEIKYLGDAN